MAKFNNFVLETKIIILSLFTLELLHDAKSSALLSWQAKFIL